MNQGINSLTTTNIHSLESQPETSNKAKGIQTRQVQTYT